VVILACLDTVGFLDIHQYLVTLGIVRLQGIRVIAVKADIRQTLDTPAILE
jgi:hypothetical protein